MSSNKPSLSFLSSSVHKRVTLAMSKGRPGSLSVPTFRFKPNTEEVTAEEAVGEDAEESLLVAPPSSPSTANGAKKSARTQSLDGDSPEGTDSSNWSFLNDIKDKITRTVEENLNRIDSIIGSTGKAKTTDPMAVSSAVEAEEDGDGEDAADIESCETREATGKVERAYFSEPEVRPSSRTPELGRREKAASGHSAPSSPMRFSDLSERSPSCSVDESAQPAEEEERVLEPLRRGGSADPETPASKRTIPKWLRFSKRNACVVVALVLYRIFSFSSFLDGFVAGLALAASMVYAWHRLTRPIRDPPAAPPLQTVPDPLYGESPSCVQKVWMNELIATDYLPESFHINQTQPALLRLDGSSLRVSYTKGRIPKRATWNEPSYEPTLVYQRIYELVGAKLTLLPEGLARKRHWSRRYPIRIELVDGPIAREAGVPSHLAKDDPKTVVLFARTGRAKEEWFRLLQAASSCQANDAEDKTRAHLSYSVFMNRLIPSPSKEAVTVGVAATDTPSEPPSPFVEIPSDFSTPTSPEGMAWLNALLGRCFWDFARDPEWAAALRLKIQRKLATIKVPSFIEELRLSEIELGTQLPQLGRMSAPTLDRRGLWMDARVTYYGAFRMTLETKLNLMKMKKTATAQDEAASRSSADAGWNQRLSSVYDEAAEVTGESSSDDEAAGEQGESAAEEAGGSPRSGGGGGGTTGRKILRIVDAIAQSRYFQQATEYKYVKKAMEGVTIPLVLTVELLSLDGTLAINVPPPPSDRLWYGFRGNPSLSLVAKPKVGERELQFSHIVEWIQNKLILEFQRILILPNMDDLILPISSAGPPSPDATTPVRD